MEIYQTSASGDKLKRHDSGTMYEDQVDIKINPHKTYQQIVGFGGSFTNASATILNDLSYQNRFKILNAYFSESGANYSLTRTHINSCDFSNYNYSYAPEEDSLLRNFNIVEDIYHIIPMILDAQKVSKDGFKIISSPWTAPPWMKDNNDWKGGKLLPKYYNTWSLYFSKYLTAYKERGIDIWGITVENEPLGNDSNWESMHFDAKEMTNFVQYYLGPRLQKDHPRVKILGYDQNRGSHLKEWANVMYENKKTARYFNGTAVHWYASTIESFPKSLQYAYKKSGGKHLINTEACIDAEVPVWKDDLWYWTKNATDWGWDWAPEDQKYLHPRYAPVNRYANDIINCLNNRVDGWIDWNMILDKEGGPNWAKNWCIAPVIADPSTDEVYFTPLYYVMSHFSKFIRPHATVIGSRSNDSTISVVATKNKDQSYTVVLFNPSEVGKDISLKILRQNIKLSIDPRSIQSIIIREIQ